MYKLTDIGVKRLSDDALIPNEPTNRDWRKYQEWLREGNTPEEKVTPQEQKQLDAEKATIELRELAADVVDFLEQGLPVPNEIKNKRAQLRQVIADAKAN